MPTINGKKYSGINADILFSVYEGRNSTLLLKFPVLNLFRGVVTKEAVAEVSVLWSRRLL
jgi:hypothetical protein